MGKLRPRQASVWQKHPDNWYVEEPWCPKRLFEEIRFQGAVHDPCCGQGTIVYAAAFAGYPFSCSDIANRWTKAPDGFSITRYQDDTRMHDNIVTNPPFDDVNKGETRETMPPFLTWALSHARNQVALLVPFKWFAGDARSRLLETTPLSRILVLTPRPSMPPGDALLDMLAHGEEPGGGKEDFAWAIFDLQNRDYLYGPRFGWLHRDKDA